MTLEREATTEVFGLSGTFPHPGWVVLDAARDQRFTGELTIDLIPEVRVYLDRGQIYLAERAHDPSLGTRLVDAGALSEVQRENGGMVIGDGEYLGRLFERVPSVDRDAVLITTEMMNDECVSWLARQQVRDVSIVPYQRHVSGLHRWELASDAEPASGDPLPAPSAGDSPVALPPPEQTLGDTSSFADALIRWDEPSWLNEPTATLRGTSAAPQLSPAVAPAPEPAVVAPAPEPAVVAPAPEPAVVAPAPEPAVVAPAPEPAVVAPEPEPLLVPEHVPASSDWVDRLADIGLPEPGDDPLSVPVALPPRVTPQPDRFEVIWPSGDIDEEFGATVRAERGHHPDYDRAGPTVRVGGFEPAASTATPSAWDFDVLQSATVDPTEPVDPLDPLDPNRAMSIDLEFLTDGTITDPTVLDDSPDDTADDVVLAVRRAVASIETGSLDARRRLAENPMLADDQMPAESTMLAESAMPAEDTMRPDVADIPLSVDGLGGSIMPTSRSVFDEDRLPAPQAPTTDVRGIVEQAPHKPVEAPRISALRRLIGNLGWR